jgi:hemerythrin superfamily protein
MLKALTIGAEIMADDANQPATAERSNISPASRKRRSPAPAATATSTKAPKQARPGAPSRKRRQGSDTPARDAASAASEAIAEAANGASTAITDHAKAIGSVARRSSATARNRIVAVPGSIKSGASKVAKATAKTATSRGFALVGAAVAGVATGLAVNLTRKAIVQAPSVMAGDWFEALKTEHKLALAIFDQIAATTDAEPAKRAILLTQLKHAFTEENVIYPALREWGDKADADKLNHDHGYVKQYLYELDALDNGSPAFLARVAAFRADLEDHIREEEDAVFPPLHAALDEAKNAHLTALANKEGFKLA